MNSDPRDSASWRCFGMLDSDEAAAFDEAARTDPELKHSRREIEAISAAIAVVTTAPVTPRSGQLCRLQARLGLNIPKKTNWTGISGWAAAAALVLLFAISRPPVNSVPLAENSSSPPPQAFSRTDTHASHPDAVLPVEPAQEGAVNHSATEIRELPGNGTTEAQIIVKGETRRLIQEIDVLRQKLESLQRRDRKRFDPVPGMALTTVVRMTAPATTPSPAASVVGSSEEPSLTAMLGDALTNRRNGDRDAVATGAVAGTSEGVEMSSMALMDVSPAPAGGAREFRTANTFSAMEAKPSAVPIYDAARDEGTFVVQNLAATEPNVTYNLWVRTESGEGPIYVGKLPKSDFHAADSFDFSLGSFGIVPTAFILTKGSEEDPAPPSVENIILQGPN